MYLVIYVRFPHMPVTGAGAVCIWSRHLCRSVPLLDQCSRDINCITAHYEGEGRCWGARCHPITIYTAQLWHGGVKSAAWHGGHWRPEYSIRCPEPGQ